MRNRVVIAVITIPLVLTEAHACHYLPERLACSAFVHTAFPLSTPIYSQLISQGFRRSGDLVYRPQCPQCRSCVPARIPVAAFSPHRSQRRTLQKNRDLHVRERPPIFDPYHYALYRRYQTVRHPEGSMANSSPEEYMEFLGCHWCDTVFVEFSLAGQLVAVAVVDQLFDALSAVYTFFDPVHARRDLGVYAVLWQIAEARRRGLEWVYLGYWIGDCRKMAYKTRYRPIQLMLNGVWQTFDDSQTPPLLPYPYHAF